MQSFESFCDEPRKAPAPLSYKQIFAQPVVSSPSIILNSDCKNQPNVPENNYRNHENWKRNQPTNFTKPYPRTVSDGFNQKVCNNNSFRKHVRFETCNGNIPTVSRSNEAIYRPQMSSKVTASKQTLNCNENIVSSDHPELPQKYNLGLSSSKPFEEIYMANIPSRQLDLSIIDSRNPSCITSNCDSENVISCLERRNTNNFSKFGPQNSKRTITNMTSSPCASRETITKGTHFNEEISSNSSSSKKSSVNDDNDDVVLDLFNYKYENFKEKSGIQFRCDYNRLINKPIVPTKIGDENFKCNKINQEIQTEETALCLSAKRAAPEEEPTVKDLLQIMKQQNEQLLLLQKQVAMLIENQDKKERQIEEAPKSYKKITQSTEENRPEIPQRKHLLNTRPVLQKPSQKLAAYSIDVMTSFEVSVRRPQTNKSNNRRFKEQIQEEPKIQEITESESNFSNKYSNNNEVETLKDSNLSLVALNEPLNIPEENHSPENSIHVDMQDYSSSDDDDNSTNIGWTVYDNILGQVNHVLNKTSKDENKIKEKKHENNPLEAVKEATINHLRNMGINVPISDSSSYDSNNSSASSCSPTEISFAVKQLLLKYMPDDRLIKMTDANAKREYQQIGQENLIKRRPEFSIATIQYMQKYNLLGKDYINANAPQSPNKNKILDITALKQQPKLM